MAGNIKGITIEFRGDTTKLDKALRNVKNDSKSVDQQLREVNRSLKFNPGNTELLRQKFGLLQQKIDKTGDEVKEFKNIEKQLRAQNVSEQSAEWQKVRRSIIEAESKLKHYKAELAKVKYANITKMGNAFKKAGSNMQTLGTYATIGAGVSVVAGKKLLELNSTQEQAETKLIEIYRKRLGVNEDVAKSTMEVASALQQEGVIGDEVTLSGAQQLATFAKYPDTVNKLLPAMDNLLVQQKGYNASAEDATGIANLLGKAMMGQTGALTKVGISFTKEQEKILKYGDEEERAAVLAEVITDNVGEMNKTFAQTDEGKMQQLKNTLGDMGERLGKMLLPALSDIANYVSEKIMPKVEQLMAFLEAHPVIAKIAVGLVALMAVGGPLLIFLGGMINAVGTIMTSFGSLVNLVKSVGSAFTLLAGPVGIAIGIIAALVAIGIILYKNWDKIKAKAAELKEWVVTKFTQIKDGVARVFEALKNAGNRYLEIITWPFRKAWSIIKAIAAKIKDVFSFKFKLPKIKLPHFAISPKGWQLGDLLKGSIPSLGIEWYANGGIFNRPTVAGVGDVRGGEAAVPLTEFYNHLNGMADSIVNGVAMAMRMQSSGSGEITIPIYLYPSGPKMGEETVKAYDTYKKILG